MAHATLTESDQGHSYKVEVRTDNSGRWYSNALRFPDDEQATAYGFDLGSRWTLVRDFRTERCEEPPNATFLIEIEEILVAFILID